MSADKVTPEALTAGEIDAAFDRRTLMTTYNSTHIAELVREARAAILEFNSDALPHEETSSSRYVEGWNDAVSELAAPLADQLEAAATEVNTLRGVIDSGNEAFRLAREQWSAELDALRAEAAKARADMEAAEQGMLCVLDSTFAVGDGTAQREIERLQAKNDQLRAELDRANAHDAHLSKASRRTVDYKKVVVEGITILANHATALVELVAACEAIGDQASGFDASPREIAAIRAAMRRLHAIGADAE